MTASIDIDRDLLIDQVITGIYLFDALESREDMREAIMRLRRRGFTTNAIARKLKISYRQVQRLTEEATKCRT